MCSCVVGRLTLAKASVESCLGWLRLLFVTSEVETLPMMGGVEDNDKFFHR